ncbi:MAG: PQQ-dependent sugar dehydrogenase [Ignavibacteria bacterium]|nr:PQQ-dependent sugar dehydrogenase [Ignavibacteria bacterium]
MNHQEKLLQKLLVILLLLSPVLSNAQYQLQPAFPNIGTFNYPIELVKADDGTNRLFVAQQRGLVYVFNNSPTANSKKVFINLSSKVSPSGSELGLLGLAFHPDHENNRYFYVNFTFDSASNYWSRISRFTTSFSNPDTALLSTEQILITLQQPYSNHNGGKLAFGPDGFLYISFGDGGSGGDPLGNGQNRSTLLGKILRINVDSASGGRNYSIPVSNPFFGNSSGYKEEIYAYGLRNTWKFSFDPPTNRLWAGDVGQNAYEEIDIIENGRNYGWNKMEGFHCYGTCDTTGKGFTRPVYEYPRSAGASITGGYVYRGSLLPSLYGKYIYADYSFGTVWALTYDGINPATNALIQDTNFAISTFGVDQNNEIYACSYAATTGRIYKIVNKSVSNLELKIAIEGFYDSVNDKLNIRDTVKVFIRQSNSPYNLIDSAQTTIDSMTLKGLYQFNNVPNGKYYLQIRHRNSLETWSRSGGDSLKKGNILNYDFTSAAPQAYGSNQILKGTKYCTYSGDVIQEGVIELSDLLYVYDDVTFFETGYIRSDINGDSIADLDDLLAVYNNSVGFVELIRP